MRRLFWVAVGAAAGVYAVRKVQTVVYAYSPAGLTDRAAGAGDSLRALVMEIADRMAEREADLRQALGMSGDEDAGIIRTIRHRGDGGATGAVGPSGSTSRPTLSPAAAADLIDHPASDHPASDSLSGSSGNPADRPGATLPRSST